MKQIPTTMKVLLKVQDDLKMGVSIFASAGGGNRKELPTLFGG